MLHSHIPLLRLGSQQLLETDFKTPAEIVHWMGAIQAQDLPMAKWAIGVRLPGCTEKEVDAALSKGDIIRIHVPRPTWHFVAPEDVYWMLELTAPSIHSSMKSRLVQLELNDKELNKCLNIFEKALSGGKQLERDELAKLLENAGIVTKGNNRFAHILGYAENVGLLCSGSVKGNQQTFALLEERVPKKKKLSTEESLAELAGRYFKSHGPATVRDFSWWSGLNLSKSREALELVKKEFISETIEGQTYRFSDKFSTDGLKEGVQLLPAFDEFVISYRDRSASIEADHHKKSISDNGIFWPLIVEKGKVKGRWKRSIAKDKVVIETSFFNKPSENLKKQLKKPAKAFGKFLGKNVELGFSE